MNSSIPFDNSKAAFGIYRNKGEVKIAKSELKTHGFSDSDIAVLYPPHPGPKDFPQRQRSSVGKGSVIGAAIGALLFIGISIMMGSDKIPVEEVRATTGFSDQGVLTVIGVLSGIVLGAACGALVGIGTPEPAGQRYGDYVDAGGILVSVHVENKEQIKEAKEILERTGAQDISLLKEGQGWESVYSKILMNNDNHHPRVVHT